MTDTAEQAGAPPDARAAGLTSAQAAELLARHGPNTVAHRRPTPLVARVASQLRDPLILVLLAAAVLTALTADLADTVVILLVVTVNTIVGVTQEIRADRAVTALSDLSAPGVRVRRDGAEVELPAAAVVPGDVVVLGEGDIVPADGDVLASSALLVDESTVTGESVPVDKSAVSPGGSAGPSHRLQAGTVVVRGHADAEVTATGAASTLGRIASLMAERREPTPLQRRLAELGRVLAFVVIALCAAYFALGVARGQPTESMAVTAVSLAVAAVPESLPAVVTLGLALGARRMAARRAIVRNLPAVETLGSVTVLATDKTGTLTEGRMVVERLWTPEGAAEVTGRGYAPRGTIIADDDSATGIERLLTAAALCNDSALVPPSSDEDGGWTALGDPTEAALLAAAAKAGLDPEALRARLPRRDAAPFDSGRKRMTTVHDADDAVAVFTKGAPEVLLAPDFLDDPAPLLARARAEADHLAAEGFRVLAVASRRLPAAPAHARDAETGLSLLGLIGIDDPPKDAARDTVAACDAAGITPVMITGDHPATARCVARRLGIVEADAGDVLTGAQLAGVPPETVRSTRIFARTTPEQKLSIIRTWHDAGAVTAMTGDGVNDGPALHQADIGVAMGRRGTEVARQAADLVLADDEIGTVVAAVEEGRRVYHNIRRFLLYALAGGTAEIAVMLLGPVLGLAVPLLAAQILWVNLLTHGLTGVALGAEPVEPGTMLRRPRPPGQSILGDGLWQGVVVLGTVVTAASLAAGVWARHAERPWQTVLFLTLLAAQLGTVLGLRTRVFTRENLFLPAAVVGSAALGLAGVYLPFLRDLLGTEPVSAGDLALVLLGVASGFAAARAYRGFHARRAGRDGESRPRSGRR
ncbi:cation-translocating P-type ATPase [Yinghuangia seranimata]|uniref:cation-translocating P-type ATPase n=1 Tax=Yinghuangia seranimata TaxID=408067 RepID=UPI00248C3B82|nr:cation-transporting P-type ATPase [Yinghuangia seranimata]MDI2124800.1 cation-transporting P-type ATPase [Yinghuangia seranimata]